MNVACRDIVGYDGNKSVPLILVVYIMVKVHFHGYMAVDGVLLLWEAIANY